MRHKYKATRCQTINGKFDSKRELARWEQLKILNQCGEITGLTRDRKACTFPLRGRDGLVVCRYIADFIYLERGNSKTIVEDSKGFKTRDYAIKRKLFIGEYGETHEHRES